MPRSSLFFLEVKILYDKPQDLAYCKIWPTQVPFKKIYAKWNDIQMVNDS